MFYEILARKSQVVSLRVFSEEPIENRYKWSSGNQSPYRDRHLPFKYHPARICCPAVICVSEKSLTLAEKASAKHFKTQGLLVTSLCDPCVAIDHIEDRFKHIMVNKQRSDIIRL